MKDLRKNSPRSLPCAEVGVWQVVGTMASLGPVTHEGGNKPMAASSALMGNLSKGFSYFSWQSISPETVSLQMFSLFHLL